MTYSEYKKFFSDVIGYGDECEIICLNVDHMICVVHFAEKPIYEVIVLVDDCHGIEIDHSRPLSVYDFLPVAFYYGNLEDCRKLFDTMIYLPNWNTSIETHHDESGRYSGRTLRYQYLNTIHEVSTKVTFTSKS